jgi:hypothetical protein
VTEAHTRRVSSWIRTLYFVFEPLETLSTEYDTRDRVTYCHGREYFP